MCYEMNIFKLCGIQELPKGMNNVQGLTQASHMENGLVKLTHSIISISQESWTDLS